MKAKFGISTIIKYKSGDKIHLAEITSIRVISDGDANRQSIVPLTDTTNN